MAIRTIRRGTFLGLGILLWAMTTEVGWTQQTREFSILPYRTEISPGSPEEDAIFISKLIPHLSKLMFGEMTGEGLSYETIDVRVDRRFARKQDGSYVFNPAGRGVIEADIQLTIKGERFYGATLAYLTWRQEFERKWIHDASPENIPLDPTPLQLIFKEPNLSPIEKVGQTLVFYQLQHRKPSNEKIPDPEYWPVSPVFDIDSVGVQVQFNIRGGVVTVLHAESNRVWQLPYPLTGSCDRWLDLYEREAKSSGLDRAAEKMKEEVRTWN